MLYVHLADMCSPSGVQIFHTSFPLLTRTRKYFWKRVLCFIPRDRD